MSSQAPRGNFWELEELVTPAAVTAATPAVTPAATDVMDVDRDHADEALDDVLGQWQDQVAAAGAVVA